MYKDLHDIMIFLILAATLYTWFMAGGVIRIAHYDVIDDVITRKL